MSIKNQIKTLKENWLIVIGLIVLVLVLSNFNGISVLQRYSPVSSISYDGSGSYEKVGLSSTMYFDEGFAPESSERKITRSASGSIEIKRGSFDIISSSLKGFVSEYNGIVLNENVNVIGKGITESKMGSYSLRIPLEGYDDFESKFKTLGKVQSLSNNLQDITESYINLEETLALEKSRLAKYEEMFESAKSVEEKLSLTDRIFQQERTIKYIEKSLENKNQRIEYVDVYLSISEKSSGFVGIAFVSFGELVKSFVDSLNNVLILIFWIVPWLVVLFLVRLVWKAFKKRK